MKTAARRRREQSVASRMAHRRPTTQKHPRPSVTYLGFDNSQQLEALRLERAHQHAIKRQTQQVKTYKQLVRALSSALGTQTKTTTTSLSEKSRTTRSKHS